MFSGGSEHPQNGYIAFYAILARPAAGSSGRKAEVWLARWLGSSGLLWLASTRVRAIGGHRAAVPERCTLSRLCLANLCACARCMGSGR